MKVLASACLSLFLAPVAVSILGMSEAQAQNRCESIDRTCRPEQQVVFELKDRVRAARAAGNTGRANDFAEDLREAEGKYGACIIVCNKHGDIHVMKMRRERNLPWQN